MHIMGFTEDRPVRAVVSYKQFGIILNGINFGNKLYGLTIKPFLMYRLQFDLCQ